MNVSDEAKLFVVRKKLLEAERTIYEANKIIANIGEPSALEPMGWSCDIPNSDSGDVNNSVKEEKECLE